MVQVEFSTNRGDLPIVAVMLTRHTEFFFYLVQQVHEIMTSWTKPNGWSYRIMTWGQKYVYSMFKYKDTSDIKTSQVMLIYFIGNEAIIHLRCINKTTMLSDNQISNENVDSNPVRMKVNFLFSLLFTLTAIWHNTCTCPLHDTHPTRCGTISISYQWLGGHS